MDPRTGVYRGLSREGAEGAYHAEARAFAAEGYVPTTETWSTALGQQVLTVEYAYLPEQAPAVLAAIADAEKQATRCPRCGDLRSPGLAQCRTCGLVFPSTEPNAAAPAAFPAAATAPAAKPSRSGSSRPLLAGVGVVLLVAVAYQMSSSASPGATSARATPTSGSGFYSTPVATLTPTVSPTSPPTFAPITLTGSGSKVPKFTIPEDTAALATITYSGGGNFAVWTVGSDGSTNDLLVNVIGRYKGTVLFDASLGEHSVALKIESSGPWTAVISPVSAARVWKTSTTATGTGDDVLLLDQPPAELVTSTIVHKGEANFVVYAFSSSGRDLLVNEIGAYNGEVQIPVGTVLVAVNADGAWSATAPK